MAPHHPPTLLPTLLRRLGLLLCAFAGTSMSLTALTDTATAATTVDVRDFGARCNGSGDDRDAISAALGHLETQGGGTLRLPAGACRIVTSSSKISIGIPSNVTIAGEGPQSQLHWTCEPSANDYSEVFRVTGRAIALQDLQIVRTGACGGVVFNLNGGVNGFSLSRVSLDGNRGQYDDYVHGVLLNGGGPKSHLRFDRIAFRNLDYGLLQPSPVTTPVSDVKVTRSRFFGNHADDLEFNAPEGKMTDISVTSSRFRSNRSASTGAGFGIGLANVQNAVIENNRFVNYRYEPVHIEDGSANIRVSHNRFRNAFTAPLGYASHVFIISGSRNVQVTRNVFDTAGNCNGIHAVLVNAGGSGYASPSGIKIHSNRLLKGRSASLLYAEGIHGVSMRANLIVPKRGC